MYQVTGRSSGEHWFVVLLAAVTIGSSTHHADAGSKYLYAWAGPAMAPHPTHSVFPDDFIAGKVVLIDLANRLAPRVVRRTDSVPGFDLPGGKSTTQAVESRQA